MLPIFPEGHIVPESGRRLDEIKPGTAYLALHSGVPVIPAYLCGTPETDDIVKSLITPSRACVCFGEPIDLSDIPADRPADKAAQAEVNARFKSGTAGLAGASPGRWRIESRCSTDRETPKLRSSDPRELLKRYPDDLQPQSELESLGGAGGYSGARLWRYRCARGLVVLRLAAQRARPKPS